PCSPPWPPASMAAARHAGEEADAGCDRERQQRTLADFVFEAVQRVVAKLAGLVSNRVRAVAHGLGGAGDRVRYELARAVRRVRNGTPSQGIQTADPRFEVLHELCDLAL